MVRIAAKHRDDPLKEECEKRMAVSNNNVRKPALFYLLMSRFREMKGSVEFHRIEKEFQYSRESMGMIKEREIFDAEELTNSNEKNQ